jgi:2-methylcitrate dehydratase
MTDPSLALLAGYAAAFDFDRLGPAAALHECRRRVIDAFGCGLAALGEEPARIARAVARRTDGAGGAQLLGITGRSLPELAGFANGVAVRCLEGNDTFPGGGGHPSDALMAILAAAQAHGADARDALAGIVVAYEIHHRLHQALRVRDKGLDAPFYTGIATAAGAARAMRLPPEQTAQAIALSVMAQLPLEVTRRGALSMWKGCAGAGAARGGVFHAVLASQGLSAPPAPFEGPRGLWDLLGRHSLAPLPADAPPAILRASYKFYLTEYHSQAAIMAALALRERIEVKDIVRVRIETYRFAWAEIGSGAEKWRPATRETADHSLPYIVAAALVDGAFSDAIFRPERFTDPRILRLIDKIEVAENPAFTAAFPAEMPCRVAITANDGTSREAEVRTPFGHPANPMTDEQIETKFHALATRALPAERAERLLGSLWRLGDPGAGIDEVFAHAVAEGQGG